MEIKIGIFCLIESVYDFYMCNFMKSNDVIIYFCFCSFFICKGLVKVENDVYDNNFNYLCFMFFLVYYVCFVVVFWVELIKIVDICNCELFGKMLWLYYFR